MDVRDPPPDPPPRGRSLIQLDYATPTAPRRNYAYVGQVVLGFVAAVAFSILLSATFAWLYLSDPSAGIAAVIALLSAGFIGLVYVIASVVAVAIGRLPGFLIGAGIGVALLILFGSLIIIIG